MKRYRRNKDCYAGGCGVPAPGPLMDCVPCRGRCKVLLHAYMEPLLRRFHLASSPTRRKANSSTMSRERGRMRGGKTRSHGANRSSRTCWIITLTLNIPNIYHTADMRAIGARRRPYSRAGGGSCQPSNRRKNLWRRTPLARGPPMLPMVRCSRSTGQRHGAGLSR